jgi:hypothetical protein
MKSGGGNEKGGRFERLVCKRLSLWLSKGERDDLFWRSAMSGGRATLQLRQDLARIQVRKAQAGDLTAISQEAYDFAERMFFECKHYENLGFGRGFICESGLIWNFWQKACREALRHNKIPVLIARQNLYPIVVITRSTQLVFQCQPLIVLPRWQAEICLFEPATAYRRLIRRRGANEQPSPVDGQPVPRAPRPSLIRNVRDADEPRLGERG